MSALEDLLAEALDLLDSQGEAAVEQFLAAHADQAPRLREALADLAATSLLKPQLEGVPRQLGDFRLGAQLGAGGMGLVYAAEQVSLGRQVALKVVRPELLFFEGARERFRREIDAVARLEHPAIVPILATGLAEGIPYYAMPLLPGCSAEVLIKRLAAGVAPPTAGAQLRAALGSERSAAASDPDGTFAGSYWQAVVRLVRKAALGIQHAHVRGVLHRDLKPSNLMVSADGRAIVLDFGLAQARGAAKFTQTGSQAGSPAYMAPEQVRGEPADERTDVYGLGAILHSLLGLEPPVWILDAEALRGRILAGQRQPLRDSELPPELRLVIDTAMDVDRQRRYPSAEALADDLQAVLEGRRIRARAVPWLVRSKRFAQRHRALATGAVALLVFLVVLPSALLWQQSRANAELAIEAQRAAKEARRADASVAVSVDTIERQLASVARDRLRNLPAVQQVAAEMLREAVALFDRLILDPRHGERAAALRIAAWMRLSEVEAALGETAAAVATAQQALAALGEAPQGPAASLRRATVRRQLASLLAENGDLKAARSVVALAHADLRVAQEEPGLAALQARELGLCLGVDAALAMAAGDAAATERAQREAVQATLRGASDAQGWLAHGIAQVNLCRFYKLAKRYAEALELAAAAEQSAVAAGTVESGWPVPRLVRALAANERARIYQEQGRNEESIAEYRVALAGLTDVLRDYPEEPSTRRLRGAAAHNLANLLVVLDRFAEARPLAEAAIQDQLVVLQRNARDEEALRFLANHRRTLCNSLLKLGDFDALEGAARELGAMAGGPELPGAAARHLLRCAEPTADAGKAAALRQEALGLLEETARRGATIRPDDPLYVPVRQDPRFVALLRPATGK